MHWKNARVALFAWLLVAGLLLRGRAAHAEDVNSAAPRFRMTVPDGFRARVDQNKSDQIMAYHRPGITAAEIGVVIAVDRMRGTLGRESPASDPKLAARGITVTTGKWKSFDIWVARQPLDVNGRPAVVYIAQVPLKPEAIQVKVLTDAAEEAEGRAMLSTVLATVDGDTNWLNDGERGRKLGEGCGRLGVSAGVILVVAFIVVRMLRRKPAAAAPSFGGAYDKPPANASFGPPSMNPPGAAATGASTKCTKCGLVAFASASCRRCGTPS